MLDGVVGAGQVLAGHFNAALQQPLMRASFEVGAEHLAQLGHRPLRDLRHFAQGDALPAILVDMADDALQFSRHALAGLAVLVEFDLQMQAGQNVIEEGRGL